MSRVLSELGKIGDTGMNRGFNNQGDYITASIAQIRDVVNARLSSAQGKLDPATLRSIFNGGVEHDALLGSLIFGLLTWVPFLSGMEAIFGGHSGFKEAFDMASSPLAATVADGAGVLFDERTGNRPRKVGAYHGGRRQDPIVSGMSGKLNGRFNLVSANENSRFARDARDEVATMLELLAILEDLEQKGVELVRLDPKTSASSQLRQAKKNNRNDGIMRSFPMPVRMAI